MFLSREQHQEVLELAGSCFRKDDQTNDALSVGFTSYDYGDVYYYGMSFVWILFNVPLKCFSDALEL